MAVCEKLEKCPFYQGKMSMDSGLGSMYKKKYCEGDKTTCARKTLLYLNSVLAYPYQCHYLKKNNTKLNSIQKLEP